MQPIIITSIAVVVALVVAAIVTYFVTVSKLKNDAESKLGNAESKAREIIDEALKTAIYLNDKYAYDAPSANGYVGILWAIGGLHDRAFVDFSITGKIRRMTYNSIKRKYNVDDYIKNIQAHL